jgi:hypothetical protein
LRQFAKADDVRRTGRFDVRGFHCGLFYRNWNEAVLLSHRDGDGPHPQPLSRAVTPEALDYAVDRPPSA